MSRSRLATHFGLALVAVGALVLASLTLGFAGAAADRMATVDVNEQSNSNMQFEFHGKNGTEYEQPVSWNITDDEFLLMEITNQFGYELTDLSVAFEQGRFQRKLVYSSNNKSVEVTQSPDEIEPGETVQIYAQCNQDRRDTYPIKISAGDDDMSVSIKRKVTIDCSDEHRIKAVST
jgi:hypothetical protein